MRSGAEEELRRDPRFFGNQCEISLGSRSPPVAKFVTLNPEHPNDAGRISEGELAAAKPQPSIQPLRDGHHSCSRGSPRPKRARNGAVA